MNKKTITNDKIIWQALSYYKKHCQNDLSNLIKSDDDVEFYNILMEKLYKLIKKYEKKANK